MQNYNGVTTKKSFEQYLADHNCHQVAITDGGMYGNVWVYFTDGDALLKCHGYQSTGFSSNFTADLLNAEVVAWSELKYEDHNDWIMTKAKNRIQHLISQAEQLQRALDKVDGYDPEHEHARFNHPLFGVNSSLAGIETARNEIEDLFKQIAGTIK